MFAPVEELCSGCAINDLLEINLIGAQQLRLAVVGELIKAH